MHRVTRPLPSSCPHSGCLLGEHTAPAAITHSLPEQTNTAGPSVLCELHTHSTAEGLECGVGQVATLNAYVRISIHTDTSTKESLVVCVCVRVCIRILEPTSCALSAVSSIPCSMLWTSALVSGCRTCTQSWRGVGSRGRETRTGPVPTPLSSRRRHSRRRSS